MRDTIPQALLDDPTQWHVRSTCRDADGDGYGMNCLRGLDCDDSNPRSTDECYHCAHATTGCACDEEGSTRSCDTLTDGEVLSPGDVCHPGVRVCSGGRWGRCEAVPSAPRVMVAPENCGSPCNPECRTTTACPTTMAEVTANGSNVAIAGRPAPGFCPGGTPPGGIQLSGGMDPPPPTDCPQSCGGACCQPDETCVSYTDMTTYSAACNNLGVTPPPPVRISVCARACAAGTVMCGRAPNAQCCNPTTEVCVESRCQPRGGTCNPDVANSCQFNNSTYPFTWGNYIQNQFMCRGVNGTQCANTHYCDVQSATCVPLDAGACQACRGFNNAQRCMQRAVTNGGEVINGIFRTPNGQDARFLRFAEYLPASTNNAVHGSGCRVGVSNNPSNCGSYICCHGGCPATGSAADDARLSDAANSLDWQFMWVGRINDGNGGISDGDPRYYNPTRGAYFDLGGPANRVVMFPTTDHVNDSCLEAFEYTIWLTDNLAATEVAPPDHPDPNKWNLAVLTQTFTQGWTRNPNARGSSEASEPASSQSNLESTASGDATADAMATVWALPCGFTARYASIVSGNAGNPGPECTFHSFDAEFDAIAGLSLEGNGLSIFHRLPYGATAGPDGVQFQTRLRSADVYFLMDTTGSMGGELMNLQSRLTSGMDGGIIQAIRRVIPDSQFGVGHVDDFPVDPYGSQPWMGGGWSFPGDQVYEHHQTITSNVMLVQNAVNALTIHSGNDWPESQLMGLWAIATGNGLGTYLPSRAASTHGSCGANTFGYPCFRLGAIPIVMLFTDAPFHNRTRDAMDYAYSSAPTSTYGGLGITTPTYAETVTALNNRGIKVIWVDTSGGGPTSESVVDGNDITSATSSFAAGGANAVYRLDSNGTGLGEAVVQAVSDLANYSRMDVTAIAIDNPMTGVDERCFIDSPPDADYGAVRLSDPAFGESEPYSSGQCTGVQTVNGGYKMKALGCLPGTAVNFRARFRNNCVMPGAVDQVFEFNIEVRGNNSYVLGTVPVTIVVPRVQYAPTGTYVETVDALEPTNPNSCGPGRVPDWTTLQFVADTPADTAISVDAITGDSITELNNPNAMSHNHWIQVGEVPPASSPMSLGGAFMTNGISPRHRYVRVKFTLKSDPMRIRTPTLNAYRVMFNCVDAS